MNDSLQAALTEAQMQCGRFGKTNSFEKPNSWCKAHNTSRSELAEQFAWSQSECLETSLHPFMVVRTHKSQRAACPCYRHSFIWYITLFSWDLSIFRSADTCLVSTYSALCSEWPDRPLYAAIPAENNSTCFGCWYLFPSSCLISTSNVMLLHFDKSLLFFSFPFFCHTM